MKVSITSILGLATAILASIFTSKSQAQQQENCEAISCLNQEEKILLNTIIQTRQLNFPMSGNEVQLNDMEILNEIKQTLSEQQGQSKLLFDSASEKKETLEQLIKSMEINKYLKLQRGARDNQSMSFVDPR